MANLKGQVDMAQGTPKRFIVHRGRIKYGSWVQVGKTQARQAYLADALCEIADCETPQARLVFDHCHRHGWVRAVLCYPHNVRIGHLEAAWLQYGLDLTVTPYWPVLMSCEPCRATVEPSGCCRKGHELIGNAVRLRLSGTKFVRHCRVCDLANKEVARRRRGAKPRWVTPRETG